MSFVQEKEYNWNYTYIYTHIHIYIIYIQERNTSLSPDQILPFKKISADVTVITLKTS